MAVPANIEAPSTIGAYVVRRATVDGREIAIYRFDETEDWAGRDTVLDYFTAEGSEAPSWLAEWRAEADWWWTADVYFEESWLWEAR